MTIYQKSLQRVIVSGSVDDKLQYQRQVFWFSSVVFACKIRWYLFEHIHDVKLWFLSLSCIIIWRTPVT